MKCGQGKSGAFARCLNCRFDPEKEGKEAQARSLLLSDRHLSLEDLRLASARIRAGEPAGFEEDEVAGVVAGMPTASANLRLALLVGGVIAALAIVLVLVALAIFLLLRRLL